MRAIFVGVVWATSFATQAQTALIDAALRGQTIYQSKCVACHSVDVNRVGPMHRGVVGRRVGSVRDYNYSAALTKASGTWTQARLLLWLQDPEKLFPGQAMGYSLGDPQERADVVAYLTTLK